MKTAVYYPYITLENESLIKHALLFWDRVEIITPFQKVDEPEDKSLCEALDLLAIPSRPSEAQQRSAHQQIIDLIARPLPEWFYVQAAMPKGFIYAEKFLPETWNALREAGLVTGMGREQDTYISNNFFALVMMSILADCCAGHTKVTITDKTDAYQALGRALAVELQAELRQPRPDEKVLVPTGVLSPSLEGIPLKNLVRLRRKESENDGQKYRAMRHRLFDEIGKVSRDLSTNGYSEADRNEVERLFIQKMNDEFGALRSELGTGRNNLIFSKEMVAFTVSAAATAGGAITLPTSVPFAIAATSLSLAGLVNKYKAERHKALDGHFVSYLHMAGLRSLGAQPS